DATLKEALRSCVSVRIGRSDAARSKYLDFSVAHIQEGPGVSARKVAALLIRDSSEQALRDMYIQSLTGSSLQSQEQVKNTLAALGLEDRDLFRSSSVVNPLFKARNEIAHEMDLTSAAVRGRGK